MMEGVELLPAYAHASDGVSRDRTDLPYWAHPSDGRANIPGRLFCTDHDLPAIPEKVMWNKIPFVFPAVHFDLFQRSAFACF